MKNEPYVIKLESEIKKLKQEIIALKKNKVSEEGFSSGKSELNANNEEIFHKLVEAAAGKIGQDFFDNIVKSIAEWLGVDCVLIGQIVDYERIEAVPLYLDGKIMHGFSYELEGTPCDITTRKGYCVYTENVIELFPKDKILVDLNAKSYIGTALYNKEGDINGVICAVSRKKLNIPPYARDIMKIIGARVTAEIERKKIEEDLIKSQDELKESNITKDKFFSIIAHDLINPFNTILGFSDLLRRKFYTYPQQKQLEFVKYIFDNAKNAYELLNNLLNWSLSQRGMLKIIPELFNLRNLSNECINIVKDFANQKNIKIVNKIDKQLNVFTDKNMLSTIIRNLLSNSVKYSHNDKTITLLNNQNENKVVIIIKDEGFGIEKERIVNLFSLIKPEIKRTVKQESGSGLGLVICKDFIEKMGGTIHVESEVGIGSKFYVSIPLT
ncbi:MAG: HAMP domain-containing histidine kinase [Bacteroidales bacterium]|nr:HAMP domain-containing histidine kinase [Bacteroidales bacterium]